MKHITLLIFSLLATVSLFSQDITGKWHGVLKVQGIQLRLNFNINQVENGYTATMDSPDQNAKGIPISSISFVDSKLKLNISNLQIEYNGLLQGDSIVGIFTQASSKMPMNLQKLTTEKNILNRPQEPKPPYPYYTEDLIFPNKKANINLAGTLTLPNKTGKYPVAILITGSGAQNRNEEMMGHKPFLVIADFLTRNGIGVFRFDDRGTASSEGNIQEATSMDFETDVEAAMAYLLSRKEILPDKIGLIGHSEGGIIAFMAGALSTTPRFIVSLAGIGIPGDELLLLQTSLILKAYGASEEIIEQRKTMNREIYDLIKKSTDNSQLSRDLNTYYENNPYIAALVPADIERSTFIQMLIKESTLPWTIAFIKYDPKNDLKKVKCPALALNGSKDMQVPATINLHAIKAGLNEGGNKRVTIKEFPGLNHLFQECTTGLPNEYENIEQTIAPVVLDEMLKWLKETVK